MDFLLAFSSSNSSEEDIAYERIQRRCLRDKSNPLTLSNPAFIKRFRLNKNAFVHVLGALKFEGFMSHAVPSTLQLAATLSLLGSGCYQHSIGNDYLIGLSQSSLSNIMKRVLQEMEEKLCPSYIKFDENSDETMNWFYNKYKIPGVIGCVDGTHIGLQKPKHNEHMFFNRKGFHSLNAMIICNHEYRITAIDSCYGGAAHDSFVWKHSDERQYLENRFNQNPNINTWLLGDSGYPLEPWCITPFRNPQDDSRKTIFNDVHSKARSIVERTIGVLKGRWRILIYNNRGRYAPEKHARFANVCSALHNICINFNIPFNHPIPEEENVTPPVEVNNGNLNQIGGRIRDYVANALTNQ